MNNQICSALCLMCALHESYLKRMIDNLKPEPPLETEQHDVSPIDSSNTNSSNDHEHPKMHASCF